MNWIAQDMHDHNISVLDLNVKRKMAYTNIDFKSTLNSRNFNTIKGLNTTKNQRGGININLEQSRVQSENENSYSD